MKNQDQLGRNYTDPTLARALTQWLFEGIVLPEKARILEPSSGLGAFTAAVRVAAPTAHIESLDPISDTPQGSNYHRMVRLEETEPESYDLAIGNPPFHLAEAHIRRLLGHCTNVAMVVRLGWLASRGDWLRGSGLSHVTILVPRPSFYRVVSTPDGDITLTGGTDCTDYAFCVWQRGYSAAPKLEWLRWRERRRRKAAPQV